MPDTMRGVHFSAVKNQVEIIDFQIPEINDVQALIKLEYSLISAGTETSMIKTARENGRDLTNLGYQAVGRIVKKGGNVPYEVGTRVAVYGGPYVAHKEYVAVPLTLMAPLNENTDPEEAAFVGLGAIAMHGLRAAKLQFGESVWVMGLGVIGQLSVQMSVNAGYQVVATDLDERKVLLAKSFGTDLAGSAAEITPQRIKAYFGQGVDAIAMTAASKAPNLVDDALPALRRGGRFIMVGVSPLNIDRAKMFDLECEVMVTRAGGPGRYDQSYEAFSRDYPLQYVRWTEGRNVKEFVRMLEKGKINTKELITHRYSFEDAAKAYDMIFSGNEEYVGVILTY